MAVVVSGSLWMQDVGMAASIQLSGSQARLEAVGAALSDITLDSVFNGAVNLTGCAVVGTLTLHGGEAFQSVHLGDVVMSGASIAVDGAFQGGFRMDNVHAQVFTTEDISFDTVPDMVVDLTMVNGRSVIFKDCDNANVQVRTRGDTQQHGVIIDGCTNSRFSGTVKDAGRQTNNTYDGVVVTGAAERNRTEFTVTYSGSGNQMRRGMTIDSGVNDHVEASILSGSGATADFADAGTGTVLTDDHIV